MLTNQILRDIGTIARGIHYISDVKYRQYQLQKGQFIFLTRVCENPGINFIELSKMLAVDKSTTTKAVSKLIEAGYFEKRQAENDRREFRLYPTEHALQIYQLVIAEENNNIAVCFEGFTSKEQALVTQLINKMSQNINRDWLKAKGDKND